jgi:hypothetical protein
MPIDKPVNQQLVNQTYKYGQDGHHLRKHNVLWFSKGGMSATSQITPVTPNKTQHHFVQPQNDWKHWSSGWNFASSDDDGSNAKNVANRIGWSVRGNACPENQKNYIHGKKAEHSCEDTNIDQWQELNAIQSINQIKSNQTSNKSSMKQRNAEEENTNVDTNFGSNTRHWW